MRFVDGRAEALPKFSYLPFGGGARFCIGATFALMEATLLLATIARRVRLERIAEFAVEPWAMITLRPRNGLQARLHWRER
jgi:cytochrome P450